MKGIWNGKGSMAIIVFAILITLALIMMNVKAAYWVDSCLNNDTMLSALETNGTFNLTQTQTISCEGLGCNNITGICNPASQNIDTTTASLIIATILSIAILFIYIAFNIEKGYSMMGIIYMVGAVGILIAALGILISAITAGSQLWLKNIVTAIYYGMILLAILTVLIFIYKMITDYIERKRKDRMEQPILKEL